MGGERVDVAQELERLMTQYGFQMSPDQLESTRDTLGRVESSELVPRLNALLEGFDFAIVHGPRGVEKVLILGAKSAYSPPEPAAGGTEDQPAEQDQREESGEIVLESQHQGTSHALTLTLEGVGGRKFQRVLLLDTGADFVVLPSSVIGQLGILPANLRNQRVQTANGPADARLATLPALWLGGERVPSVEVAFIDDGKLDNSGLLGMSVLKRFVVTIDDEDNKVVLNKR